MERFELAVYEAIHSKFFLMQLLEHNQNRSFCKVFMKFSKKLDWALNKLVLQCFQTIL